MIFRQLFDPVSSTYSYVLGDKDARQAVIIDPVLDRTDSYLTLLNQLDLELVVALDTHTHADHITGLGKLRDETGCRTMMGEQAVADCLSEKFTDGQAVHFGSQKLLVIYTPGHTDDSYCFFVENDERSMLFTGDTLLIRGTGRTDFQNGNPSDQYRSLFEKLLEYPEDTLVYPGHDYKGWLMSTIGEERAFNPRLLVGSVSEYVEMMNSLNLANPKLMDVAVPANQACGGVS